MDKMLELSREQAYAAYVQQLLLQVIERSKDYSKGHISSIRALLADAWEELRLKPTALSVQDMEQLATEVDRFLARKALTDNQAQRYEKMLLSPFFARIDFTEAGGEREKIVIGLYSLKDHDGALLVHDWRAPISSLYYDSMPGDVSYMSPMGEIKGKMHLKRQYKMEDGKLKYFVDTDIGIDDGLLLDILSGATSRHIRQIVSTIQSEQNRAIRYENAKLLSVVGGAGSGKTSVAMHRAAFLMYRQRDHLDAKRIATLSPSNSFSEYISTVLPELGEENTLTVTLHKICSDLINARIEMPLMQTEALLDETNTLRRDSVRYKSGKEFLEMMRSFVQDFMRTGPEFEDIALGKNVLITKSELTRLYRVDYNLLSPALRLIRIQTVLNNRLEAWEKSLYKQYESQLIKSYRGKDLEMATRFAVSQRLQPVKQKIKQLLNQDGLTLYVKALKNAPEILERAALENAQAKYVWWEDAPAISYIMLALGFASPDKNMRHLIVDEAQDYTDIALSMLNLYFPQAQVTLLGDPKQRTCPALPPCDPKRWNDCFQTPDAPLVELTRCYRSTLPITRLCNAILPDAEQVVPFGREGDMPKVEAASDEKIVSAVKELVDAGYKSIAVITRTVHEAKRIADFIPKAHLLDGSDEDILTDPGDISVGGYHLMKGLEFDAVVVVWEDARLSDGERRRLYTACSRALHSLTLLLGENLVHDLGIVL
ncbi:MAG: AAA family ATPase [Clostridia bacterium]|nr:AAA family ATPase [Clostridia bacterium]